MSDNPVDGEHGQEANHPQHPRRAMATVRKPRTKWLRALSNFNPATDEIGEGVLTWWRLVTILDADPAWARWWQTARAARLELRPCGRPAVDTVNLMRRGSTVYAMGWASTHRQYTTQSDDPPEPVQDLVLNECRTIMAGIARQLDLPAPPELSRDILGARR